jgi:ribosome-associated protein
MRSNAAAGRGRDYDTQRSPAHTADPMSFPTDPTTEPDSHAEPGSEPYHERPSKTRRKQASHDLQELGEAAVALPDARLTGLAVAEVLMDAIHTYKKTKTFEGRRRQMQYIGKLMRIHDVEPLRQAVTDMQLGRAKDSLALHQAERWRAELIASDDEVTRWTHAHPQTDVQQLRNLIRAARKDAALEPEKRSGRAYRELFQFIKECTANE